MKLAGILFLLAGICLLGLAVYYYLQETNTTLSPLPDSEGVKVIFITPTPEK